MTAAGIPPLRTDLAAPLVLIGVGMAVPSAALLGPKFTAIAFGVPVVMAATLYAICRPSVMLAVMIVVEVTNLSGVLTPGRALVPRALLGLGLLTLAIALRDPMMRGRLNRGTLIGVGLVTCYLLTQTLAVVGSQAVDLSMVELRNSASDCLYLILILALAQISGKYWVAAAAFVLPLALLSFLTLINQVVFGGAASFGGFATVTEASGELVTTLRYGGPLPDSNFWGRQIVMGVPLAGALLVRAISSGQRRAAFGWAAAMFALLAGIYLTQSRGTFVATAVVLFVWVVASGPTARRRGLLILPLMGLMLLIPGIGNRLLAVFTDLSNHGLNHGVDPSIIGRMAAQQIAWSMFWDRPLFGFGPDTYIAIGIPWYGGTVRTPVLDFTNGPDAPHNLYAQLAGESGVVGLVGWVVLVGGFIVYLFIWITRIAGSRKASSQRSLGAAVLAALVGWSAASIFLHLAFFRTLAIMLALAGALACSAVPDAERTFRVGRRVGVIVLSSALGLAAAASVLFASAIETHTASQRVTVLPTREMTMNYPYAFSIRTRDVLLSTNAAIMAADAPGVIAIADTVRGIITISVTQTDAEAARADLDDAVVHARNQLVSFGIASSFTLIEVGGITQTTDTPRPIGWSVVGLLAGAAVAAVTASAAGWLRSPRRTGLGPEEEPAVAKSAILDSR